MSPIGGGGKGKRSLDAELNLTSFIDLLSVCVCFLLVSAVWIQVGSVEVKQQAGTEGAVATADQYALEVRFQSEEALDIDIKKGAARAALIKVSASAPGELPQAMHDELQNWMKKSAEAKDVASALVHAKTAVPYGQMVKVLDVLRTLKITNLGVVAPGA